MYNNTIENLPEDIILHIYSMLDNRDMITLNNTCSTFKNINYKWGCYKSLKLDRNTNYKKFLEKNTSKKHIFLEEIIISNIDNPLQWFPLKWVKKMVFNNCDFNEHLITPPVNKKHFPTEILIIHDYQRTNNKNTIYIDWSSLKNLRVLDIYAYNLDFTGLEKCLNLKSIRIDLAMDKIIPKSISSFKNLIFLATTCLSKDELHFCSKILRICFINKLVPFTSNSEFVPNFHLTHKQNYVNIQCYDPIDYLI